MKFAFMTFSCPELTLPEALATAKRYGYDGIEPRIGSGHKHGIETDLSIEGRNAARDAAAKAGIALCCLATSASFANPETTHANIELTHQAIDLAHDVGARCIRVFGGAIGENMSREQAIDLLISSLKQVSDHAGDRDIKVCLETHDSWCDPQHVVEVLRGVNHPAISANWDIMHPVRVVKVTMKQAFDALHPYIQHVHFHDGITTAEGKLELMPIGTGDIDHKTAFQLLREMGYEGYASGEWISWEPFDVHLPRELTTAKRLLAR